MPRSVYVLLSFAAYCLIAGSIQSAQAQELASIPAHFFKEWRVTQDCSEQHAGPLGHVQVGLRFRVSRTSLSEDAQSYKLEVASTEKSLSSLPGKWQNVTIEYRAGARMTKLPADFECVPGEEASSPFLAMSNYATIAEPWSELEHWVGKVDIHGQQHHILIFPRSTTDGGSPTRAVVVLYDANTADNVKLDHGSIIHTE